MTKPDYDGINRPRPDDGLGRRGAIRALVFSNTFSACTLAAPGQSLEAAGDGHYLIRVSRSDTPTGFFCATGNAAP